MSRRVRRGAVALELGLVTPLLVTLSAGVIGLGLLVEHATAVSAAAREGARAGAAILEGADPTGNVLLAVADGRARDALAEAGLTCGYGCTVNVTWAADEVTGLWTLTVALEVPVTPFARVLSPEVRLHGTASVVTRQQD